MRTCGKLPTSQGSNRSSSNIIDWQFLHLCRFLTDGISLRSGDFSRNGNIAEIRAGSLSCHLFTRLLPAGSLCSLSLASDSKVSLLAGYITAKKCHTAKQLWMVFCKNHTNDNILQEQKKSLKPAEHFKCHQHTESLKCCQVTKKGVFFLWEYRQACVLRPTETQHGILNKSLSNISFTAELFSNKKLLNLGL